MQHFIGWTDIDGEMSKETLKGKINVLLSSLDLNFVLKALAKISYLIFDNGYKNETELRKNYLSSTLLHTIQTYEQKNSVGFVFHKQALLILEQLVFRINTSTKTFPKKEVIGKLFLYINSLIERIDYHLDVNIEGADVVIRRSLFYHRAKNGQAFSLPRAIFIYEKIKDKVSQKFDVNQTLQNHFSFNLKEFFQTIYMIQCLAENNIIIKKSDFIHNKVGREHLFNILKWFVLSPDDFGIEMPTQSQDLYNFFQLRQKPLVMIENNTFFVCHLDFLLDLFWSGIYYLIINSEDKISKKERENFFNYLGEAFEAYVQLITKDCFGDTFFENLKINTTNYSLNDGVIQLDKDWLLVIETKGTRENVEISGANPLHAAYRRIIARESTSGQKKKGIIQLAERINDFRTHNGFTGRITPLLITGCKLKDVGGILSKIAWPEWAKELQKENAYMEFEKCHQNDKPLIAEIEDWERVLSLVKHSQVNLKQFLEYRNDKNFYHMFLNELFWVYVYEKKIKPKPYPLLQDEFQHFVQQMCQEVC